MFCLRSWLPLLFIPTNASPAFIFLFFICSYFLNRPCVYCSVLLLILFLTSCNWSDRCFFDFSSNWFLPRPLPISIPYPTSLLLPTHPVAIVDDATAATATATASTAAAAINASVADMLNATAKTLAGAGAAAEDLVAMRNEWTGLGIEWLRNLLGKREWRVDCMDIYIRL